MAWPWNGTTLIEGEPMGEGAKRMPWKGMQPVVARSRQGYQKGLPLSKRAMRAVEHRLTRHPALPNWARLIPPVSTA